MAQTSRPGGRSDDFIDKGVDQVRKVADRVEGLATGAAGQMREVSDRTGEVAGNFKGALDKSVKDQPMACAFRGRRPLVPAHGDHLFQAMATSVARGA